MNEPTDHDAYADPAALLYLNLLKRTLTRAVLEGRDGDASLHDPATLTGMSRIKHRMLNATVGFAGAGGYDVQVTKRKPFDPEVREFGRDWPRSAESMIGLRRMENIQQCVTTVLREGIPGDLIETGVWRGGACIFMKGVLSAYGDSNRVVWVADSFAGLPPPDPDRYPADARDFEYTPELLTVSEAEVRDNFRRYQLLDDNVRFLVGWFKDTLPTAPMERLALMRLDGDYYESTMDALNALYPKLSDGGFCIIDDYTLASCQEAVRDFRLREGIREPLIDIDGSGAFWRKAAEA